MKHYIDVDKLKVLLSDLKENHKYYNGDFHDGVVFTVDKAKELIDSLQQEQPVEGLEEEIDEECHRYFNSMTPEQFLNTPNTVIARHFYELGKNARKEDK